MSPRPAQRVQPLLSEPSLRTVPHRRSPLLRLLLPVSPEALRQQLFLPPMSSSAGCAEASVFTAGFRLTAVLFSVLFSLLFRSPAVLFRVRAGFFSSAAPLSRAVSVFPAAVSATFFSAALSVSAAPVFRRRPALLAAVLLPVALLRTALGFFASAAVAVLVLLSEAVSVFLLVTVFFTGFFSASMPLFSSSSLILPPSLCIPSITKMRLA